MSSVTVTSTLTQPASTPLSFVLFGATGRSGLPFLHQSLSRGHLVTAFTRSHAQSKLPHELAQHPNLTLVEANLQDTEKIQEAIGVARSDVVYMMLNSEPAPHTAVSQGTEQTIRALRHLREAAVAAASSNQSGAADKTPVEPVPFIAISGWGAGPTKPYLTRWYEKATHAIAGLFEFHRKSYEDSNRMLQLSQAAKEDGLIKPIILVPAVLTATKGVTPHKYGDAHAMKDSINVFMTISRENMAQVAIELGEKAHRGETVPDFVALHNSD